MNTYEIRLQQLLDRGFYKTRCSIVNDQLQHSFLFHQIDKSEYTNEQWNEYINYIDNLLK